MRKLLFALGLLAGTSASSQFVQANYVQSWTGTFRVHGTETGSSGDGITWSRSFTAEGTATLKADNKSSIYFNWPSPAVTGTETADQLAAKYNVWNVNITVKTSHKAPSTGCSGTDNTECNFSTSAKAQVALGGSAAGFSLLYGLPQLEMPCTFTSCGKVSENKENYITVVPPSLQVPLETPNGKSIKGSKTITEGNKTITISWDFNPS